MKNFFIQHSKTLEFDGTDFLYDNGAYINNNTLKLNDINISLPFLARMFKNFRYNFFFISDDQYLYTMNKSRKTIEEIGVIKDRILDVCMKENILILTDKEILVFNKYYELIGSKEIDINEEMIATSNENNNITDNNITDNNITNNNITDNNITDNNITDNNITNNNITDNNITNCRIISAEEMFCILSKNKCVVYDINLERISTMNYDIKDLVYIKKYNIFACSIGNKVKFIEPNGLEHGKEIDIECDRMCLVKIDDIDLLLCHNNGLCSLYYMKNFQWYKKMEIRGNFYETEDNTVIVRNGRFLRKHYIYGVDEHRFIIDGVKINYNNLDKALIPPPYYYKQIHIGSQILRYCSSYNLGTSILFNRVKDDIIVDKLRHCKIGSNSTFNKKKNDLIIATIDKLIYYRIDNNDRFEFVNEIAIDQSLLRNYGVINDLLIIEDNVIIRIDNEIYAFNFLLKRFNTVVFLSTEIRKMIKEKTILQVYNIDGMLGILFTDGTFVYNCAYKILENNKSENSVEYNNKSENSVEYNNKSENSVEYNNKSENSVEYNNKSENFVEYNNKSENSVEYNNKSENFVEDNNIKLLKFNLNLKNSFHLNFTVNRKNHYVIFLLSNHLLQYYKENNYMTIDGVNKFILYDKYVILTKKQEMVIYDNEKIVSTSYAEEGLVPLLVSRNRIVCYTRFGTLETSTNKVFSNRLVRSLIEQRKYREAAEICDVDHVDYRIFYKEGKCPVDVVNDLTNNQILLLISVIHFNSEILHENDVIKRLIRAFNAEIIYSTKDNRLDSKFQHVPYIMEHAISHLFATPYLKDDANFDYNTCIDSDYNTKDCIDSDHNTKDCIHSDHNTKDCIDSDYNTKDCIDSDYNTKDCIHSDHNTKDCIHSDHNTKDCIDSDYNIKDAKSDYNTKDAKSDYNIKNAKSDYNTKDAKSDYNIKNANYTKDAYNYNNSHEGKKNESISEQFVKTSETDQFLVIDDPVNSLNALLPRLDAKKHLNALVNIFILIGRADFCFYLRDCEDAVRILTNLISTREILNAAIKTMSLVKIKLAYEICQTDYNTFQSFCNEATNLPFSLNNYIGDWHSALYYLVKHHEIQNELLKANSSNTKCSNDEMDFIIKYAIKHNITNDLLLFYYFSIFKTNFYVIVANIVEEPLKAFILYTKGNNKSAALEVSKKHLLWREALSWYYTPYLTTEFITLLEEKNRFLEIGEIYENYIIRENPFNNYENYKKAIKAYLTDWGFKEAFSLYKKLKITIQKLENEKFLEIKNSIEKLFYNALLKYFNNYTNNVIDKITKFSKYKDRLSKIRKRLDENIEGTQTTYSYSVVSAKTKKNALTKDRPGGIYEHEFVLNEIKNIILSIHAYQKKINSIKNVFMEFNFIEINSSLLTLEKYLDIDLKKEIEKIWNYQRYDIDENRPIIEKPLI